MARPYRPDRPSKPRPTFHKKEKQPKVFPGRAAYLAKTGQIANPSAPAAPADGRLRIFLDDERPAPAGWTLVKSVHAFKELIEATDPSTIREISLDWYLGTGCANGDAAAEYLGGVFAERANEFTDLMWVLCHSSDDRKAIEMAKTINQAIPEFTEDGPNIIVTVGRPKGCRAW